MRKNQWQCIEIWMKEEGKKNERATKKYFQTALACASVCMSDELMSWFRLCLERVCRADGRVSRNDNRNRDHNGGSGDRLYRCQLRRSDHDDLGRLDQ